MIVAILDDDGKALESEVSQLVRVRDGSIDDEITIFSQRGTFHLISDHHTQRGPSFPKPIDVFIDALTGQITSRSKDGSIRHDHIDLPPDVANGLPPNILAGMFVRLAAC